jgi:undecaprenyl-diphosphatase
VAIWQAVVLGIVEGLTEFIPISSTGHLTVVEKLMGFDVDAKAVTGFTAVIQVGAIAAVVLYFRADIARLLAAWVGGVRDPARRGTADHRMAWAVLAGSIPVLVVAVAARDLVKGPFRNLWWVAGALVAWSAVMVFAERVARRARSEVDISVRDGLVVGVVQCASLVPGVSRSGATISGGLLRGFDRVAATRFSFLLAIPTMVAAAVYELGDALSSGVGWAPTLVGTLVSFVVGYASVVWLLRFVSRHSIARFVWYRVPAGVFVALLILTGAVASR